VALRGRIDEGSIRSDPARGDALREHFVALFGVGVAPARSAARFAW
jgi:hypothetical protein